ncbi:MAG: microviridin/marinostatin family tricyclic proteinase inhibitor [Candidatus Eremiobacterota bacterium]
MSLINPDRFLPHFGPYRTRRAEAARLPASPIRSTAPVHSGLALRARMDELNGSLDGLYAGWNGFGGRVPQTPKPFFASLLQGQFPDGVATTPKIPSDGGGLSTTLKFPSDGEDGGPGHFLRNLFHNRHQTPPPREFPEGPDFLVPQPEVTGTTLPGASLNPLTTGYALDRNSDGRYTAGVDGVLVLDVDGDGRVTDRDVTATDRALSDSAQAARFDPDRDGVLSMTELEEARAEVWFDSNADGRLDPSELSTRYLANGSRTLLLSPPVRGTREETSLASVDLVNRTYRTAGVPSPPVDPLPPVR